MICSDLDRVGFLWRHKIPLPIQGALLWKIASRRSPTTLAASTGRKEAVVNSVVLLRQGHFLIIGPFVATDSVKGLGDLWQR